jgi:hypothetical protein
VLTSYITQTRRLLQLPAAPSTLYTDTDLTSYINTARSQLAGEGECIRARGTQSTVAGTNVYPFSGFNLGVSATTGIAGAIHVRSLAYQVGTGQRWITPREWEWFELYVLNNPLANQPTDPAATVGGGPPRVWSQYGQGTVPVAGTTIGQGGSFYLNYPDDVYVLVGDCVCYPIPLADDTTVEAIPFMWTDAVPFFAAYYALLSSQMQARMADALRYYEMYKEFVERARKAANPSVLRFQYQQASDIVDASKFGIKQQGRGG